jgi:hypothetical protein
MKKIIFISFGWLVAATAFAQSAGSIIATNDATPIMIEHVEKINDQAVTKDTVLAPPAFTYNLQPKRFVTTVQIDTIRAAKISSEPLTKLYRTYAKLGIGNYSTFMGEFSAGSMRSKTNAWGAHVKHFSAGSGPQEVAGNFSGFSQQDVNLFGKHFYKKHVLYGGFDFDRDVIYNYGSVTPTNIFTKSASKQFFDYYGANADIISHFPDSEAVNHHEFIRYYHLNDRFKTNEANFLLTSSLGRFIRTEHLDLDLGVDYNHNSAETDSANNTIVFFKPMFGFSGNKFMIRIGGNVSIDAGDGKSLAYFNPQFMASYDIVNHIITPYLSIGGYLERNSYRTLSMENPFVMPAAAFDLHNTEHKYELMFGVRGSLSSELVYDVHAMRVELLNAPFFVNTTLAQDPFRNKFAVVYDTVDEVNVHGQLGWDHFEKIHITATGDWYKYNMTHELHPWHTPTLRMSLLATYNIQDKILSHAEIYYLNGQYASLREGTTNTVVNMKGLVDVNIGFEYRYTKFLSVFLNFNNIAGQRYERWYAYPTQKFNLLGGLTYTF